MNQGTAFFAPLSVATAIKGFCAGLDPPPAGCEWQDRHWLELKRGPSPLFVPLATTSISANLASPSWKNAVFVRSKIIQRTAGARRAAAHARVYGGHLV